MNFGLTFFPTDTSIAPAELGAAAEDAGFEALFFAEHTHIPVERETPYSGGGELPEKYKRTHDPFVALATVAQATETLRLGTGICLVVQADVVRYRPLLLVLAVGKASSSLYALGAFIFDDDVFAYLANFVIDGLLVLVALWLWSLAGRVGDPAAPS